MKPMALLNGKPIRMGEPAVAVGELGLLLGDGIFDTVKVVHGKPVWLEPHLERLRNSAKWAGLDVPENLAEQAAEVIAITGLQNGSIRFTVTRGVSPTGRFSNPPEQPTILITAAEQAAAKEVVSAGIAPWQINEQSPEVYHKTTSCMARLQAWRLAKKMGLGEMVFINRAGFVAEGIWSNLFFMEGGILRTPSINCGILSGITRAKLLEVAQSSGVATAEGQYDQQQLERADEIFFTNANVLVLPVSSFAGKGLKVKVGKELQKLMMQVISE